MNGIKVRVDCKGSLRETPVGILLKEASCAIEDIKGAGRSAIVHKTEVGVYSSRANLCAMPSVSASCKGTLAKDFPAVFLREASCTVRDASGSLIRSEARVKVDVRSGEFLADYWKSDTKGVAPDACKKTIEYFKFESDKWAGSKEFEARFVRSVLESKAYDLSDVLGKFEPEDFYEGRRQFLKSYLGKRLYLFEPDMKEFFDGKSLLRFASMGKVSGADTYLYSFLQGIFGEFEAEVLRYVP